MLRNLVDLAIPLSCLALLALSIWLWVKWQDALRLLAETEGKLELLEQAFASWAGEDPRP